MPKSDTSNTTTQEITEFVSAMLKKQGFPGDFLLLYPKCESEAGIDLITTLSTLDQARSILESAAEECKPENATRVPRYDRGTRQ